VSAPGWPARLCLGGVELRPPRLRDGPAWVEVRARNQDWLEPWEAVAPAAATVPWRERQTLGSWAAAVRALRRQGRAGEAVSFLVLADGAPAGQLTVGGMVRAAVQGGSLGYWVDRRVAGRGVGTVAVALAVDHCLTVVGLHRVEAAVRPENTPSRRLLRRLGFREEGLAERSLWVDGAWRDHLAYALTAEELPPGGLVTRLRPDTPARLPGWPVDRP